MFTLSIEKILVIGLIAMFLVGPDHLPKYAATLGRWVRVARRMTDEAKQRVSEEIGEDVQWERLDPRRYSPRRMLADAWNSEEPGAPRASGGPAEADDDHRAVLVSLRSNTAPIPIASGGASFGGDGTGSDSVSFEH